MPKNVDISDPRFGPRVESLRTARGLTREQLAERIERDYRTVLDIENGKRGRSQEATIMALARALNVEFHVLMDLDTPLTPQEKAAAEPPSPTEHEPLQPETVPAPDAPGEQRDAAPTDASPPRKRRRYLWPTVTVAVALVAVAAFAVISSLDRPIVDPPRPPLPDMHLSTDSDCAFHAFIEGREHLLKLKRTQARAAFERALACDSTFAMAWLMLTHPDMLPSVDKREAYIAKAMAYSGDASEAERLHIEAVNAHLHDNHERCIDAYERLVALDSTDTEAMRGLAAHYLTAGRVPEGIAMYELAVHVHPEDGMSLNRLAYAYFHKGDFTRALRWADEYVRVARGEPNPYDTRGDILAWHGDWVAAAASYEKALDRDPDFFPSLQSLGCLQLLSGNVGEARKHFERMLRDDDPTFRARGRSLLAVTSVFEGRLLEAVGALEVAIAEDEADGVVSDADGPPMKQTAIADICLQTGDAARAAEWIDRAVAWGAEYEPGVVREWHVDRVRILAHHDPTAAAEALKQMGEAIGSDAPRYRAATGWLALASGDAEEARRGFDLAMVRVRGFDERYGKGLACLELGDAEGAVNAFEDAMHRPTPTHVLYAARCVKAYYHLARAYDALGRPRDAAAQYQKFVDWWRETDVPIPEVRDARERLNELAGMQAEG